MGRVGFALFWTVALVAIARAERINHEGRILGRAPVVTTPIEFDTSAADAIVSAMQIMPVTNPWNEDVSRLPTRTDSDTIMTQIRSDLATARRTLRAFYEMNYVLVPDNQPRVPINFFMYPDDSDLDGGSGTIGMYPIATITPVETWPRDTGNLTLDQWQRDVNNIGGDRHAIMVAPGVGSIWETWLMKLVGMNWQASNGAKFDLKSNMLRPNGLTSGDAAGLQMFPALVRYDECERGMVEHALRLVVKQSRKAYIYPATHYASSLTGSQYPAMGQRLRLKASFVIPASWTIEEKAVLLALKKYGGLVADNGGFFSFSVCPDERFPSNAFDHLSTIDVSNFEVVQSTGPTGGPRSPGAPTADAGADFTVQFPAVATLNGIISDPSGSAVISWKQYSGTGTATFVDPSQAQTSAMFDGPGSYTLMLSVADGVHAVAYDAVVVHSVPASSPALSGNNFVLSFASVVGQHYRVEETNDLTSGSWSILADNISGTGGAIPITDVGAVSALQRYYRVVVFP